MTEDERAKSEGVRTVMAKRVIMKEDFIRKSNDDLLCESIFLICRWLTENIHTDKEETWSKKK